MSTEHVEGPIVLPLGRCKEVVTQYISGLEFDAAVVVWHGAISAMPCAEGHLLLIALDGNDEQHLDDVRCAADRWRTHAGGPILVFYTLPGAVTDAARRAHLCRLATQWNACVLEPIAPGGAEELAIGIGALCEFMYCAGVIGLDGANFAWMTAPPSIARCFSTTYQPGTAEWETPPNWRPILTHASKALLSIRFVADTTLFDINGICQSVENHLPPEVNLLPGSSEAEGSPTVTLVVIEPSDGPR